MSLDGRIAVTPGGDDEEWMATFSTLPDDQIDALLAGTSSLPVAAGLTDLVQELRADAERHGAPAMTPALRAQIDRPVATGSATRRRRLLAGGLGALLFGGASMGVAAAQDVLPAPIQDATASVAGMLGVELPRAAEHDAPAADDSDDDADGGSDPSTRATDEDRDQEAPVDGPTATMPAAGPPSSTPGPPDSTPGGAVPADPGTPGDEEPATPGTGNGQETGEGNGQESGNGQGNGTNASEPGQTNGRGTARL